MSLKLAKCEAYDEVNEIPEIRTEEVPRLKEKYKEVTGNDTSLHDDDIVNLIAMADDDYDRETLVLGMLDVEQGKQPTFN